MDLDAQALFGKMIYCIIVSDLILSYSEEAVA